MRELISGLNSELGPISRTPPQASPMPPRELAPERFEPGEIRTPEEARRLEAKRFGRELGRHARLVLGSVLSSGPAGKSAGELSNELGMFETDVRNAVEKLVEERAVERIGGRVRPAGVRGQGEIRMFEVERVLPGRAIVHINNRWFGILDSPDFSGPRGIIKPGNEFRARSELFHVGDRLHARVFAVVEALG